METKGDTFFSNVKYIFPKSNQKDILKNRVVLLGYTILYLIALILLDS